ncbi:hypothetical protein [Mesorhizobium metallidurans]|nr:hypothetical protein [Mesorhizobium metallidurans]
MNAKIEQALHILSAVVTFAAAFGLDPVVVASSLSAINVGLAILAGFRAEP